MQIYFAPKIVKLATILILTGDRWNLSLLFWMLPHLSVSQISGACVLFMF